MASPKLNIWTPILVGLAVGCSLIMDDLPPPPDEAMARTGGAAPAAGNAGESSSASGGVIGAGGMSAGGQTGAAGEGGCSACDCDGDGHEAEECGGDDCDDQDRDVQPGQQNFFEAPRRGGGWDYDCDGEDEPGEQVIDCSGIPTCETMEYEGFIAEDGDLDCGSLTDWGRCTLVNMVLCAYDVTDSTRVVGCH